MGIPEPQFLQSQEKDEDGGTRSPKYPSTVTKVQRVRESLLLLDDDVVVVVRCAAIT